MFKILGKKIESGTKFFGSFKIGETIDGKPLESPIIVIVGEHSGPIVFSSGAVHGNEIIGPLIIRKVMNELSPDLLQGTFIATPIVNTPCFSTRSRIDPSELPSFIQDLNRVFPGKIDGTFTQRIAYKLLNDVISKAQYCIDIHSSGLGGLWPPYAHILPENDFPNPEVYKKTLKMAEASGMTFIVKNYPLDGSLICSAIKQNIPAIITELGPVMKVEKKTLELGAIGVMNILKMLGMLTGDIQKPKKQITITKLIPLNANKSGFLEKRVNVGDEISCGDVLAEVSDWKGNVVETIRAPVDSYILRLADFGTVRTGDRFVNLGIPE